MWGHIFIKVIHTHNFIPRDWLGKLLVSSIIRHYLLCNIKKHIVASMGTTVYSDDFYQDF